MINPYFLMTLLYLSLAVLVALDQSLSLFGLSQLFPGIRWLRVHFITLGTLTEIGFWLMPALVAGRQGKKTPTTRWLTWLALNAGIIILLVGIPLMNGGLMVAGGTLVFSAVLLLIRQLLAIGPQPVSWRMSRGRSFYIAGLGYLLLGIIIGAGFWQGWGASLGMKVPIEVHIHANNWGFMSMFFAGLLVDFYPSFSHRQLAWSQSIPVIFWLMVVGALGLVIGPWIGSNWFSVPGLLLHTAGTLLLLANVIRPWLSERWSPGMWHLVSSYFWIFAPVLVAPLIIAGVEGFPGAGIEQNAPQALIYGWALQFSYALVPYFFTRVFLPEEEARLGGNWFSLGATHLAAVLFWIGIFVADYRALLQGSAYGLWFLSMLSIVGQLWQTTRRGWAQRVEEEEPSELLVT